MRASNKDNYEFFLSEIAWPSDEAAGYIVELMRSASHIKDFQKLFAALAPPETDDFDDLERDLQQDSLRILVMNFAASQLRESLKLFSDFAKVPGYTQLQETWSEKQKRSAQHLGDCVNQFATGSGLLHSILKPLRDKTFHYKPAAAQEWVRLRMEQERDHKPPVSYVHLGEQSFGPGMAFDESLYSQHLFWKDHEPGGLLAAQTEVWNLQMVFLDFVQALTETLLKNSKIPGGRECTWVLRYRNGFTPKSGK